MELLQSIFLYFARFADKKGVLQNFTKAEGNESYNRFRQLVEDLPDQPAVSGITDFVVAASEESIKRRIQTFKSAYLFVDYGEIQSMQTALKVQEDEIQLAATIAVPLSANSLNMAEEIILTDNLLSLVLAIRQYMKNDRSDPFVKRLTFPQSIQPFYAPDLSRSFGWTLVFKMQGIAMI